VGHICVREGDGDDEVKDWGGTLSRHQNGKVEKKKKKRDCKV